jgi:hypothetical protein
LPYYPGKDDKGIPYELKTRGEKLIIDYTGLSIIEIYDLDLDIYLFLMREAYIYKLSQSEEGRKYLDNCFRIQQTKPNRSMMREKMAKGG